MSNTKKIVLEKLSLEDNIQQNTEDEDDEISAELPSFKSVIFKQNNRLFYDSEQCKWVEVDNFAFSDHANHFETSDNSSSLALLDSKILDDEASNIDDSRIIVEELKKNLEINTTTESSSQPNSLDASFDATGGAKPKIKSPREKNAARPQRKNSPRLRKLSNEHKLPSKSDSATESTPSSSKFVKKPARRTSPVARKLNLDKTAKKLGQNKSHSATNLHKLSVREYHGSFQLRRSSATSAPDNAVRSSSCDSLHKISIKELAGRKADYSHVESKVKQYINAGLSRPPSSKASNLMNVNDPYGKSFVLSPGRKSLSMSNILQDDFFCATSSRRSSIRSDLKSFLSAKHLDDLQIRVSNQPSRETSKSRDSLYRHDQVSRLLDDLSGDEEDAKVDDNVVFEVEDLIQLAMDERKGKVEAKQVLAQLQANYDELQKKFAAAEIRIDQLRFGNEDVKNLECPLSSGEEESITIKSNPLTSHYYTLNEIQEQLYGLEILSSNASSFSSSEKKATLAKLKSSYDFILSKTQSSEKDSNQREFFRLLQEVGSKLSTAIMDDSDEPDYQSFAKSASQLAQSSEELDPLEKVAKWRSSNYGSNSTSPTPLKSSLEQGSSPGDLDSGCPGSERSLFNNNNFANPVQSQLARNLSHVQEEENYITDLSSDERLDTVDQEIAKMKVALELSPRKSDEMTTPRGQTSILASQIDQEIRSLRNFFDDHREEMMSLIKEGEKKPAATVSAGCSPIIFNASPRRKPLRKSVQKIPSISDSDQDFWNVQEERRQEFERFRNLKKHKRQLQQPQFAIGQPMTSNSLTDVNRISALFPKVDEGRHVATADGDQIFIPKLNLDDQWSIDDQQHLKVSLDSMKADKSCQTPIAVEDAQSKVVVMQTQCCLHDNKKKRKKNQDLIALLETLRHANETAIQMKFRSEKLLHDLQSEMEDLVK